MTAFLIAIGVIIILGIIVIIGLLLKQPSLPSADPGKDHKIGELEEALKKAEGEKNELIGKNKELFAQHERLKAKFEAQDKECKDLQKKVTKFETNEEQQKKAEEKKLGDLENSRKAFEDAEKRVNDEALAKRQMEEEERDRLWAEHENSVISLLTDICKKPQFGFTSYNNESLPEDFHGDFKPDFLVEFLNQYVIFDAKFSEKPANLQTYINNQVQKTAKKVEGKEKIYPTIFLVVPTFAIGELKKTDYYEKSFTFYVVPPEALAPILASLKKIEHYEFAEDLDPQKREAFVDLVAQFDFHISTRNAIEFHLLQHGIETLQKTQSTDPNLAKKVALKKAKIRPFNFKGAEHKQLVATPEMVQERLMELIAPKSQIDKEDIKRLRG